MVWAVAESPDVPQAAEHRPPGVSTVDLSVMGSLACVAAHIAGDPVVGHVFASLRIGFDSTPIGLGGRSTNQDHDPLYLAPMTPIPHKREEGRA
jgi:hypothetical protein